MGFFEKLLGKKHNQHNVFSTPKENDAEIPPEKKKGDKIIQQKPESANSYYELARRLSFEGNDDEAINNLNKTISLDSRLEKAWLFRAEIYRYKKDYHKALTDTQEVIRINPTNYEANYQLGYACYKLKKYPEAFKYLEKCIQIDPSSITPKTLIREIREEMLEEVDKPLDL